jgi:tetratricopeptide (TPR) repeat protein
LLDLRDYAEGRACLEQALCIAHEIGSRHDEAWGCAYLGDSHSVLGDYARARGYLEEALAVFREVANRGGEVWALTNLGGVSQCLGDNARALEHGDLALRIAHEIGHHHLEGMAFAELGFVHEVLGKPVAAEAYWRKAIDMSRRANRAKEVIYQGQAGLARAALAQGRLAQAHALMADILPDLEIGTFTDPSARPLQTYLTCFQVLAAAGDLRAAGILDRAQSLLQDWAARCPDEETRKSFLENVPWNREIVRDWNLAHAAA